MVVSIFFSIPSFQSADLGGRVGWLLKAERVKTLFLSPLEGGGGAGRGGIPAGPHLRSSRLSRHPRLRRAPNRICEKIVILWGKGPRPLVGRAPSPGGPGPKPPGDLAHRPLPVDFLQAKLVSDVQPGPKPLGTWPTSP